MNDIAEWAESRFGFYVDRYWQNGRWVLERGPIRLAEHHRRILRHVFTPGDDGRLPYDVAAWCEPAKSGKSAIAGLCAEYAALHLDGDVIMASNKKTQAASLMYKSLTDSVEWNPHLRLEPAKYEVTFRNGNVARAIPSNSRGEAGARFSLAVFDELWGYVYQDSTRLWAEFKTDPTRAASVKLAIGYGGYHDSELWQEVLERGKGAPVPELADIGDGRGEPACWRNGRHFTFWSHQPRQPWQTPQWLAGQAASLPGAEYSRMIECDFVSQSQGEFVPAEAWQRCYSPHVKPLARGEKTALVLGLDLSVSGDSTGLVGVSKWGDGYALRYCQAWIPPVGGTLDYDLTVVPAIDDLLRHNNPVLLAYDEFQGHYLITSHRERWMLQAAKFSQQEERELADYYLRNMILSRRLYHGGDEVMAKHVANAGLKTSDDSGHLRIVKGGRGKIDALVSLSMATWRAQAMGLPEDETFISEVRKVNTDLFPEIQAEAGAVLATSRMAKLAAIQDRDPVRLRYMGGKSGTLNVHLRPTNRTITLSAREPEFTVSNSEACFLLNLDGWSEQLEPIA